MGARVKRASRPVGVERAPSPFRKEEIAAPSGTAANASSASGATSPRSSVAACPGYIYILRSLSLPTRARARARGTRIYAGVASERGRGAPREGARTVVGRAPQNAQPHTARLYSTRATYACYRARPRYEGLVLVPFTRLE